MGIKARKVLTIMVATLVLEGLAGIALAADAPRWVAALYVDAQKAVGLRWNLVPGATGYKILRSKVKGSGYAELTTVTNPQYIDKALVPGDTYYYVLQTVTGAEVSANSEEKAVPIPGEKKVDEVLVPEWDTIGLSQTTEFGKTTFKVGLVWQKSANPNVVAYNVYRSTASGKDYALIGSVSDVKLVDSSVEKDKTYYYVITALDNSFQETKYSVEKSVLVKEEAKQAAKKGEVKNEIKLVSVKQLARIPKTTAEPQLGTPIDLVFDRDRGVLYVVSQGPNVVMSYNEDGDYLGQFGTAGIMPGQIGKLICIAIDADGLLYVTDVARKVIMVFDGKGNFKREFSTSAKCKADDTTEPIITGVAVGGDGSVYASDNENGHIMVFDSRGKLERCFADQATGKDRGIGFISKAGALVIDAKGRLHVQDYGPSRTQVFDPLKGEALFSLGEGVKGLIGAFVKVGKPCPDDTNKLIYGLDSAMGNIQAFDYETGDYKFTLVGEDKKLKFNERADWPYTSTRAMTIDSQGRYWVLMGMEKAIVQLQLVEPLK